MQNHGYFKRQTKRLIVKKKNKNSNNNKKQRFLLSQSQGTVQYCFTGRYDTCTLSPRYLT